MEDKGERRNEKKIRRREKEEEADEKAVKTERKRKENEELEAKSEPPPHSRNASPSQMLGNNMTPIKGRLGKNTTPTRRNSEKLIQRYQKNPSEGHRTLSIHLLQTSSAQYGEQKSSKKRKVKRQRNPYL